MHERNDTHSLSRRAFIAPCSWFEHGIGGVGVSAKSGMPMSSYWPTVSHQPMLASVRDVSKVCSAPIATGSL